MGKNGRKDVSALRFFHLRFAGHELEGPLVIFPLDVVDAVAVIASPESGPTFRILRTA